MEGRVELEGEVEQEGVTGRACPLFAITVLNKNKIRRRYSGKEGGVDGRVTWIWVGGGYENKALINNVFYI